MIYYNEFVIIRKDNLELIVLKQVERELKEGPKDIVPDIFALFEELMNGKKLGLPVSKALPSIAKGLHELRLSGRYGEYRVFYVIKVKRAIFILHATSKKTQKIDRRTIDLLKLRMRNLDI